MAKDNQSMLATVTKAVVNQGAQPPAPAKSKTAELMFEKYKPKFAELLAGSGMSPERFVRIMITEVASNDKLLTIAVNNPASVLGACMEMASMGLDPSIPNEAFLIPYGAAVQMQAGYKGYQKLAMESARESGAPYSLFAVQPVYKKDVYERTFGDTPGVRHQPPPFGQDRGEVVGYYAIARDGSGRLSHQEMTVEQVKEHQQKFCKGLSNSKSPFFNGQNFDAYGLKTVVRRLCNRDLPMGPKLARALSTDTDAEPTLTISPPLYTASDLALPEPIAATDGNNPEAETNLAGSNPGEQPTTVVVENLNEETGELTEVVSKPNYEEPVIAPRSVVASQEKSPAEIAAGFREKAKKIRDEEHGKATATKYTGDAQD